MVKGIDHCSFRKLKSISNYVIVSEKSHLSKKKELCFEDLEKECLIIPIPKFIPFQNGNKFIPAKRDDLIIIPLTGEEDVMDYGIAYHKNTTAYTLIAISPPYLPSWLL